MPVTDITHDLEALTLTITAEFAAPVERVWQIYADPRQLERVWGPPGYPATFTDFDFRPGGRATYFMTSPEGEKYGGWWEFTEIAEPSTLRFDDGFADGDLVPLPDMPVTANTYSISSAGEGTRLVAVGAFASTEDLEKVLGMGMIEGATLAINQIDDLLAA